MNHKINLRTIHKIILYWGKNAKAQGQVVIIMPKTEDLANKSAASFPPFTPPPHLFRAETSLTSRRLVSPPETLSWSQSGCSPLPAPPPTHLNNAVVICQTGPSVCVCRRSRVMACVIGVCQGQCIWCAFTSARPRCVRLIEMDACTSKHSEKVSACDR